MAFLLSLVGIKLLLYEFIFLLFQNIWSIFLNKAPLFLNKGKQFYNALINTNNQCAAIPAQIPPNVCTNIAVPVSFL